MLYQKVGKCSKNDRDISEEHRSLLEVVLFANLVQFEHQNNKDYILIINIILLILHVNKDYSII